MSQLLSTFNSFFYNLIFDSRDGWLKCSIPTSDKHCQTLCKHLRHAFTGVAQLLWKSISPKRGYKRTKWVSSAGRLCAPSERHSGGAGSRAAPSHLSQLPLDTSLGLSHQVEEVLRRTQDMLDRLCYSANLGAPRNPSGKLKVDSQAKPLRRWKD